MTEISEKTDEFLREINMHYKQTDIDKITAIFLDDMDRGMDAKESSLAMIPTYISVDGVATDNRPIIVIDAGGTNLRTALVTFKNGVPETTMFNKYTVLGTKGEVTVDEFFGDIAEKILPLTELSDTVGFCFSYPMKIFPNLDGEIITLTKEVQIKDAKGVIIGETLNDQLRKRGVTKKMKFALLNDTVAGLMGCIANVDLSACDGMVGLILGTGCNSCYTEIGSRITKIPNTKDMIINCESGNFSGGFSGVADDMLDAVSVNSGAFCFEKKVSGVYMGKIITQTMKLAAEKGIVSENFLNPEGGELLMLDLDNYLRGEKNHITEMCQGEDDEVLKYVIDNCFERSARLVCAKISALCLHCDGGKTKEHPFGLVPEGSMFWNSLLFKPKFDRYLESHITGKLGRYVEIFKAENTTMAGAALAAMLN